MSQRPPGSRPASRSPADDQKLTLPPVQTRDDGQQARGERESSQSEQGTQEFTSRQQQLPQQQPLPSPQSIQASLSSEEWRSPAPLSRDLGVHSMLNPSDPERERGEAFPGRRLSGSVAASPLSTAMSSPRYGESPTVGTPLPFPGQPLVGTPPATENYPLPFPGRRILTPKSPRSASLGRVPGTIDAKLSPFIISRDRSYSMEPGQASDVPPMPPPPAPPGLPHQQQQQQQQQTQYGFPPGGQSAASDRASSLPRTPLSQGASPSSIAGSVNPGSQRSSPVPSFVKGGPPPPAGSSYFPGSTIGAAVQSGGGVAFQTGAMAPEGPYPASQTGPLTSASVTSSRQSSAASQDHVQVLTITTAQGLYHVPVDVHQASRLADEKRARNAGASARFRQRRKEKEKEASLSIEKLQHQTRDLERRLREAEQEKDFYRAERDRLRDVLFRTPGMREIALQAPPSPRLSRPPPPPPSFQSQGSQMAPNRIHLYSSNISNNDNNHHRSHRHHNTSERVAVRKELQDGRE